MKITRDHVQISVTPEAEDFTPEQCAKDYDNPGFVEAVRAMRKKHRRWGWCCVKVSVRFKNGPEDLEGTAYLGTCSYESRQDFVENSGYYDQMVDEAIAELQNQYHHHCEDLADQLIDLADNEDDTLGQLLTEAAKALKLTAVDTPVTA